MNSEIFDRVAGIIIDAGGRVVGRTRLQKIAYLLEVSGQGRGFSFDYKHYGPFSDDLAAASGKAALLGVVREDECPTAWGGFYSIYTVDMSKKAAERVDPSNLAAVAASADAVELELAATAVFLALKGHSDAWSETERRKPEKAGAGRIDKAKALYRELRSIPTPRPLPVIS